MPMTDGSDRTGVVIPPPSEGVTPSRNGPSSSKGSQGALGRESGGGEPPAYLRAVLSDAELLLKHIAAIGIAVDDDVRRAILKARDCPPGGWTEDISNALLIAYTKLTARLCPVTAESLRACDGDTVRQYRNITALIAMVIIPFSLLSFMTSAISESIRKDITIANGLAVKLTAQLGTTQAPVTNQVKAAPNAEVVTQLQQFTGTIRAIDARARQLNIFVFKMVPDPYADLRGNQDAFRRKFELPPGLPDIVNIKEQKIGVLQNVRYFGQSVVDNVSFLYGAVATCVLPVLYALLGTCAYLLRRLEQETSAKTFIPSRANSARFLIAGICGAVVGLFNFTITQTASISPLAIAFLAGYAIDVFFSFLEALTKSIPGGPAKVPATANP